MILSHWYFCSCIKLDQYETTDVLSIVSTLEERYPAQQKLEALLKLELHSELVRSYFVPILVNLLLPDAARQTVPNDDYTYTAKLNQKCKQMLLGLINQNRKEQKSHTSSRPLMMVIHKLDKLTTKDVAELLKTMLPDIQIHAQDTTTSYLETDVFAVEVFLLSLLHHIGQTDPTLLEGLEHGDLLDAALDGSCGELPYQLALEISAKTITLRRDLLHLFPSDWIVRPYCVRLMLNQLIYVEKQFEIDGKRTEADALRWEARQLDLFRKCYNRCELNLPTIWIDDRLDSEEKHRVCAILWQAVSMDMAFTVDPKKTFDTFHGYWQATLYNERLSTWDIPEDCTYTRRIILLGGKTPVRHKNAELQRRHVSRALCSPWQPHIAPVEGIPFSEFPLLAKPFSAFRSFAATGMLLRIMLFCQYVIPDYRLTTFYRALMNLCCCLMSEDAQNEMRSTGTGGVWSRPLRGLAMYAAQNVRNMGTGRLFTRIPKNLINSISSEKEYNQAELSKLMKHDSFLVCGHWAAISIRAHSSVIPEMATPWLMKQKGHKLSSAHDLCGKLFQEHVGDAVNFMDALELLCQCYMDELDDPNHWSGASWIDDYRDWLETGAQDVTPIPVSRVLLSRPISLEEWNQFKLNKKHYFTPDAWPVVHTMRMRTLLHNQYETLEGFPLQLWYSEWYESVTGLNTADLTKEPILLYLLCDLMKPAGEGQPCPELAAQASKIFIQVLDLIYNAASDDFIICVDRVNQYLRLNEAQYPYTESMLSDLQLRNLQKLLSRQDDLAAAMPLMYRFLADCADRLQNPDVPDISQRMSNSWSNCIHRNSVRTCLISVDAWNPLTDRFAVNNSDKLLVAQPVQNLARSFREASITNAFAVPVDRPTNNQNLLGIVIEKYGRGQYAKYMVNCGLGRLVEATVDVELEFNPGDFVCVRCQFNDDAGCQMTYTLSSTAWSPGGHDEVVQVQKVNFRISQGYSALTLQLPNGSRSQMSWDYRRDPEDRTRLHQALDLWCPNIDCYFSGQYQFPENKYEAVFDPSLGFYVPVTRSYPRLLMEKLLNRNNENRSVRLTLIRAEGDGCLFSAAPGHNYYLRNEDWRPGSLERLVDEVESQGMVPGLIIQASVGFHHGLPCMEIDWNDPVDRINLEWAGLFNEESTYVLTRDAKKNFWLDVEFRGKIHHIKGGFEGGAPFRDSGSDIQNVQLVSDGWDHSHQREQVFGCAPLRSYSLDRHSRSAEQVRRLISLSAGDVMTIADVLEFRNKEGYQRVRLTNNMMVYCASESLSMLNAPTDVQKHFRKCIVEYVYFSNYASASYDVPAVEIPALQNAGDTVRGVVAQFVPTINQNANVVHTVWFEENGILFDECQIPAAAFQTAPWSNGAVVIASRQENGLWSITCENRNIYVRALWEIADHSQQEDAVITGLTLAQDVKVPGIGFCVVSQDRSKPVLHLWNNAIELEEDPLCGLTNTQGIVSRSNSRRNSHIVFPYAKWTDVVRLRQGNTEFWGESERGEFSQAAKAWTTELIVEAPLSQKADGLYDVRRVFHRATPADQARNHEQNDQLMAGIIEAYREWLDEEGEFPRHVTGTIVNGKLLIDLLRVPARFDRDTKDDVWVNEIPFLSDGDKSWGTQSPELHYGRTVRAMLKLEGDVWHATCLDALPYRLDKTLVNHFNAANGKLVQQRLCYAGLDENQHLRFEWGIGFFFVARPEDILDSFGNQIAMNLFYGDLITSFKLLPGEGEFGWQMCIPSDSIQRGLPSQVWDDSEAGIIQMLKIHINRVRGKVSISEVTVTEKSIHNNIRGGEVWRFRAFYNGLLDHESIQRLLSESGPDTEDRTILAELDMNQDRRNMHYLTFSYLSLDRDLDPAKLIRRTICLVAGNIHEIEKQYKSLPSNDYCLRFYIPGNLPPEDAAITDNGGMVISVRRRAFSLDESKLRVLYSEDRKDEYRGNNMLVRLLQAPNAYSPEWQGSVIHASVRTVSCLTEWLKAVQTGLVVLGKPENGQVPLEIAPGIMCNIPEKNVSGEVLSGAMATIRLAGDHVQAEVCLPSDRRYFPKEGRPAELLPKDGVIGRYMDIQRRSSHGDRSQEDGVFAPKSEDTIEGTHFTIAGFPQIQIRNPLILDSVLCSKPPRVYWIKSDQPGLYQTGSPCYRAIRLQIHNNVPFYKYLPPCERKEPEPSEWHRVSFRDDVPETIAYSLYAGRWHYHDKETAVYNSEQHYIYKWQLQRTAGYQNIVFYLNEDHNLRVHTSELLQYGYSIREINEYGLPRQNDWYPIAYADRNSIWIELMPGRLLEIPKNVLFIAQKKDESRYSLQNFHSEYLAPGDLIRLNENQSYIGGQRMLMVSDFHFGIRSYFRGRNHLPVIDGVLGSHVQLGGGRLTLTYPTTNTASWQNKHLVCIDGKNRLYSLNSANPFNPGDTVMLKLDDNGELLIAGFDRPHFIQLAVDSEWTNARWVNSYMRNLSARSNLFRALGGTVIADVLWSGFEPAVSSEQTPLKVRVAIRFRDLDTLPEGTIISGECLGMMTQWGERFILVRAGNTVLRVAPESIISGVPGFAAFTAASILSANRQILWLHRQADGWHGGLPDTRNLSQSNVKLLYPVSLSENDQYRSGFLCQSESTCQFFWLPIREASRTKADIDAVWHSLSRRPLRSVKRMENGEVSLIEADESRLRFAQLKAFPAKYRVVIHQFLEHKDNGSLRYLAELYPLGDLIYMDSETDLTVSPDDPIPAELIAVHQHHVAAIPYGTHLNIQRIPEWINARLQSCLTDGTYQYNRLKPSPIYGEYRKIIRNGSNDARNGKLNLRLPKLSANSRDDAPVDLRLTYFAALLTHSAPKLSHELRREAELEAEKALAVWLDNQGFFIANCFNGIKNHKHRYYLDLVPVASAILLLHTLPFGADHKLMTAAREMSVHLTRIIGLACDNSVHVEIILSKWLLWDHLNMYTAWRKLNSVDLCGRPLPSDEKLRPTRRLSQLQCTTLMNICNDICRNQHTDCDSNMKLVANCLLYSIGELKDYQLFGKEFQAKNSPYYTNRLAILGHALTPPASRASAAVERLSKNMVRTLTGIFECAYPLCVMTDRALPLPAEDQEVIRKAHKTLRSMLYDYQNRA